MILFDAVVAHAAVSSRVALAYLFPDLFRGVKVKPFRRSEPSRDLADDPPVLSGVSRRRDDVLVVLDAALGVGVETLFFATCYAGQNDVGFTRRFG